ncbi:MAG: alpha-D-ribose 1-methylphosphonate 5-triphosphate diphosphatase [Neomegalonema sp.]|nr:alpha-D-ribose 1-methylphosphonate 5-triphosphate diphosphatase [Neomegalonema sp.]
MTAPALRLVGAQVLGPDGLSESPLCLGQSQILEGAAHAREIDLSGYWILPGIVDLHGDGFERHMAPRRGAAVDKIRALQTVEAELAASGITTAWLAQFFSWEGGMRGPDFAEDLAAALEAYQHQALLDLRFQLRLETHMLEDLPRAEALIARHRVGYVVLNDHLPHEALAKGKRPPRLTGAALKGGRSPEAHLALLQQLAANAPKVPQALAGLCARLQQAGVVIGSHDDPSGEIRAGFAAMGARISEFPTSLQAAMAARDAGTPVIMGAPNVVRGGSHDGRVSAREVIAAGACDALVSDYHYPSIAHAALMLAREGVLPIEQAWALVAAKPARILGLEDRGWLLPGTRADALICAPETGRIFGTLAAGRWSFLQAPLAERFM